MKKTIAKTLCLVLTMAMLLAFAPSAMAAEAVTLPSGNAAGRLTDGLTVSYGDGTAMTETALLTDGFYYSSAERDTLGVYPANDNGAKMITLDSTNRVIEFSWAEEKSVKRLEMWIWRVGAIKNYDIEVFDGNTWVKHAEGSFDQSQPLPEDSSFNGGAAIFYLAQFKPVTTNKLRFIVTEFGNSQTSAAVAEVLPRSTDMVNLLADNSLLEANLKTAYKHDSSVTPYRRVFSSPYAVGFTSSANFSQFGTFGAQTPAPNYANSESVNIWPYFSGGYPHKLITNPTTGDVAFYATSFMASPQKINLIKISSNNGGTYKCVKVYYSNAADKPGATSAGWHLISEMAGTFSKSNPAVVNLPTTVAAMHWKVELSGIEGDMRMMPVEMYSIASDSKFYGEGIEGNISVLTDEDYYATKERRALSDFSTAAHKDKYIKLTQSNSGIEYAWEEEMKVARLDLWIIGVGGIDGYEVQTSDDGSVWNPVKTGNFAKYDTELNDVSNAGSNTRPQASYYPIVLDNAINTKHLRFVAKSFYNDAKGAMISEAWVRSSNRVNLGITNFYEYLNVGKNEGYSPYMVGYLRSGTKGGTSVLMSEFKGIVWPYTSSGTFVNYELTARPGDLTSIWQTMGFFKSKVKVNSVGINLKSGSITRFEVYANIKDGLEAWNWTPPMPSGADWKLIATFDCNLTPITDNVLFEIPKAIEASQYMIKVTGFDNSSATATQIEGFNLYSLADSELTPFMEEPEFTGNVAAGETLTFKVYSCNNTDENATVFFALYDGEILSSVSKVDMPLAGAKEHTAEYIVPSTATGDNLSVKAFFWNGKNLAPVLDGAPLELPAK